MHGSWSWECKSKFARSARPICRICGPTAWISPAPCGITSPPFAEKAWHGLHYLLTGSSGESGLPLGFLLEGGREVGEDMGYGSPRLFEPAEVQQLNTALAPITDDELWSRFDAEAMEAESIYPCIWDEEEEELARST